MSIAAPVSYDTTVSYTTVNGTAISGTDFVASSGTVTILANTTSAVVNIGLIDDNAHHSSRDFSLTLNNPHADYGTVPVIGTSSAGATITDDDPITNSPPVGSVHISGSLSVGGTLTANSGVTDADGIGPLHFWWERSVDGTLWTHVGGDIQTYAVATGDPGRIFRVRVSYTDGHGTNEQVTSTPTGQVAPLHLRRR